MIDENALLTATLAKVYVEQGHLKEAAGIYRHLLKAAPGQPQYLDSLQEIEVRLAKDKPQADQELARLLSTWIDMEIGYASLKRLATLRDNRVPRKTETETETD